MLAYGAHSPTKDIDSLAANDERIREASQHTSLAIPLDWAAVADPPYNYEDRRRHLRVRFREPLDLGA